MSSALNCLLLLELHEHGSVPQSVQHCASSLDKNFYNIIINNVSWNFVQTAKQWYKTHYNHQLYWNVILLFDQDGWMKWRVFVTCSVCHLWTSVISSKKFLHISRSKKRIWERPSLQMKGFLWVYLQWILGKQVVTLRNWLVRTDHTVRQAT